MNRGLHMTRRSCDRARVDGASARLIIGAILTFSCFVASAQSLQTAAAAANQGMNPPAPWTSELIESIDSYLPDGAFNHGRYYLDHFAGPPDADEVGGPSTQLSNGDIVVAGLVPDFGGSKLCNNGTALCNIGLVRYSPTGVRQTWSNPGSYGHLNNQYVIFTNPSGVEGYQYIRDVKAVNGVIYVMVDLPSGTSQNLGLHNVDVQAFHEDGSPLFGGPGAFGYPDLDEGEDFYGAQMVVINNTRLMAVATAYDSIGPYVAVTRFDIAADGSLSQNASWGQPYVSGFPNRIIRYYAPNSLCASSPCNTVPAYAVRQEGTNFEDFYVAGSLQFDGDDWDAFALKISSQDGSQKPEFGGEGWVDVPFDQPNSNFNDRGAGLYVYQDDVFVAAQVDRGCHPGFGLAKLDGSTGLLDLAFGDFGGIVYGGVPFDDPGCSNFPDDDIPFAMSATGGRLGVVGFSHWVDQGGTEFVDPLLAVVNAVDGSLIDFGRHPLKRADGSRAGDAVLYGVHGGSSPTSPFTVSGNGRDTGAGNSLSYLTGRFVPLSGDQIFSSGFGTGNDQ